MKHTIIVGWGLALASLAAAETLPRPQQDTEGWSLSRGAVVTDASGTRFVRLSLSVDRGNSALGNTFAIAAGGAYALNIDFRSDNALSVRDKGSWIYLAFRDAQEKNVGEQVQLVEATTDWTRKSIPFTAPTGTAKVFMSIRQQQRKGTLDICEVTLKQADAAGKVVASFTPSALTALAWLVSPGEKLSPQGERSPRDGNLFAPYLKGQAPAIVRDLGTEMVDGVRVQKVVFRSLTVGGEPQDVYAVIARPAAEGVYPGILWLHGGYGCAEAQRAIRFAKAGYVAISPDLPGIGDPKNCPNTTGPWRARFAKLSWAAKPEPTADGTFDAVVAALQAFDLLLAQPGVIRERVAVTGISMGGYTTTMVTGLLGKRVRAAYSIYGCGFYDRGSTWSKELADLPDDQREAWLHHFDAGRRAACIQAPYFIAAAASDHFFWPEAVNATVAAIPSGANQLYAPANHRLTGITNEVNLDLLYFSYWLKDEGQPFPKVKVESCLPQTDGGRQVAFSVQAPLSILTATVYVTVGGESWEKSTWDIYPARSIATNRFQAIIPADKVTPRGAWFVNVSDARPATAGSLVYGTEAVGTAPALRPLGVYP